GPQCRFGRGSCGRDVTGCESETAAHRLEPRDRLTLRRHARAVELSKGVGEHERRTIDIASELAREARDLGGPSHRPVTAYRARKRDELRRGSACIRVSARKKGPRPGVGGLESVDPPTAATRERDGLAGPRASERYVAALDRIQRDLGEARHLPLRDAGVAHLGESVAQKARLLIELTRDTDGLARGPDRVGD